MIQMEIDKWPSILEGLNTIFCPNTLLLQSKLSINENQQNHKQCDIKDGFIVSLFHDQFNFEIDLEELKSTDRDVQQYNMGRNAASDIMFTRTHKYVIKTITAQNFQYFRKTFYEYYFKLQQNSSLIAKIYGIFTIETQQLSTKYFIIMENLFQYVWESDILNIYDIKGSSINRSMKDFEAQYQIQQEQLKQGMKKLVKGKDQDFLRINFFSQMSVEFKQNLLRRIEEETKHLQEGKIMDYSLMIIVSWFPIKQQLNGSRVVWLDDNQCAAIGIIDYLQEYNQSKKLETKVKQFFGIFKQEKQISCVDSESYRNRFIQFFKQAMDL
ncbi:hypothetical protein pb186bvf_003758 [Paramecium bursaria]